MCGVHGRGQGLPATRGDGANKKPAGLARGGRVRWGLGQRALAQAQQAGAVALAASAYSSIWSKFM